MWHEHTGCCWKSLFQISMLSSLCFVTQGKALCKQPVLLCTSVAEPTPRRNKIWLWFCNFHYILFFAKTDWVSYCSGLTPLSGTGHSCSVEKHLDFNSEAFLLILSLWSCSHWHVKSFVFSKLLDNETPSPNRVNNQIHFTFLPVRGFKVLTSS